MKQSRPVSIVVTQILMALSLVPLGLGLAFVFLRALIMNPTNLLTLRSIVFFVISFGLVTTLLIYGFGGLWKRKMHGYWLGLFFLAVLNLKNIYTLAQTIRGFRVLDSSAYGRLTILDFSLQCVMVLLIFLLFLKVWFGKKEKSFFRPPLDVEQG